MFLSIFSSEKLRTVKSILFPVFLLMLLMSSSSFAQQTVNNASLQTWWHANHELNADTEVASNNVRRSTFYDVKVSTAANAASRFDSFTYMSIPRAGKGKVGYTKTDGAEFVDNANLTMSWSSFLYSEEVWVEVTLRGNHTFSSVDQVTIRPSKLNFQKERVNDKTVRIRVPYSPDGYRFSVEFDSHLYTAYNDMSGTSGNLTENGGGNSRAIHTEPRNALLIFAEPILSSSERSRTVPTDASGTIHYPAQGEVRNLNNVNADIIYFRPGTYYMGRDYHASFDGGSRVKWIYIAPGAYVKGAFGFLSTSISQFKFTGYGVLSGEQYIYEADTTKPGYTVNTDAKCHTTCVKMIRYESNGSGQKLDLQGITVNEPPYHSFVVYGNEVEGIAMNVNSYKQVGSWVWQTDGIELYKNSRMKNTFFHANDDVLKMYHSNVQTDNTVIWKGENGPVIQWGWDNQRNLNEIYVRNTDVIHSRLYWRDEKGNFCIINASPHWNGGSSNGSNFLRGMTIENINVEGMTMCAIRIYSLISIADNAIKIKNFHIDAWNKLDPSSHVNRFERIGDVFIGSNALSIENFTVGNEYVTTANNNTGATQLGRFDFKLSNWSATQTTVNCTPQTMTFEPIADQPLGSSLMLDAYSDSGLAVTYSVSGGGATITGGKTLNVGNVSGEISVTASQAGTAGPGGFCPVSINRKFFAGDRPPEAIWIGGTFNTWALQPMSYNSTKKQHEYVVQLNAGNYAMKFANTSNWSGDDWGKGSGLQSVVVNTKGQPDSNSTFTITQGGEYTISFDRPNLKYSITSPIACKTQSVTISPIANQQIASTVALAGSANSTLPLTWKIETGAPAGARISGGNQLYVGDAAGPVTVTASQAGNAEYCPATASLTFQVLKSSSCTLQQAITFAAIPNKNLAVDARSFGITATANSSLPVSFAVVGPATLTGTTVSLSGAAGTVSITANQAGNSEYCAATPVTRSFTVTTGDVTHEAAMFIGASFNSWNPSSRSMALTNEVWVTDVRLAAGAHQMKFANTGNWTGKDWGNAQGLSGTAVNTTGGAPNISFSVTTTGDYTISFNDVSLAYSITPKISTCGNDCGPITAGSTYIIKAKHSGKALDVSNVSSNNGAAIQQWEYAGGANQQWKLEDVGGGLYKLIARHSNKALDVVGGSLADGVNTHQWDSLAVESQRWKIEVASEGYYYIINSKSGKALAVSDASMTNGSTVRQFTAGTGDNFKWGFEKI